MFASIYDIDQASFDRQCIFPGDVERIAGLGLDIYADDVEVSLTVNHRCAAGAAEQVKKAEAVHRPGPAPAVF